MTDGMTATKEKGKRPSWTIQIKTEEALRFESKESISLEHRHITHIHMAFSRTLVYRCSI